MRPITLNLGGIKDAVVAAALDEIQRASYDTLQNDPSSSGTAMATLIGAAAGDVVYFTSQYTTAYAQISVNGLIASPPFRIRLAANTTVYVATTGSDSNSGTDPSAPWLTLQHAINNLMNNADLNGFTVIIQVAAGTYAGFTMSGSWVGAVPTNTAQNFVTLSGDTVTPANVVISSAILLTNGATIALQGLTFASSGNGIQASTGARVNVAGNCTFGVCSSSHMVVNQGGEISINSSYSVIGGAASHFILSTCGIIASQSFVTATLTGTFTITTFATTVRGGVLATNSMVFNISAATVTGTRYSAVSNGVIDTVGGGANYFPGSIGGSTATGGQYL